ncbi:MAG: hypothetical protein E4H14_08615 [Candidatus Thorarchaeota archaeon]|nr:MAG: hypothetical protein E4H14_08615 [Candidatus Thorarchaeota archaeon]
MSKGERILSIDEEEWTSTPEEVAKELKLFVEEFDSFTPELFAEVNFHLLRHAGLTISSRNELCEISIHSKTCPKCDLLYVAKKCPLWYRLYKIVTWDIVKRAPPCIRFAYAKKTIRTVTNYLARVNLIDPPFYKTRGAPSCNALRSWGYCTPNEYCRAMKTGSTLEYIAARERVKISRKHS